MATYNQIPKYYDKNGVEVNIDDVVKSLGTAAVKNVGNNEGNIPLLGAGGKIASSHIPSLAITHTFVVANQADMLALGSQGAERGDVCKRTDLGNSFILTVDDASVLSNWVPLTDETTTLFVRDDADGTGYAARAYLKIYPCTQAEYNALATKESDVVYVIREVT
jgi:hypothetical protein